MGAIYVVLSKKNTSGGGESLHQLVNKLRYYGADAYIFYFDKTNSKVSNPFDYYNNVVAEKIEDKKGNTVIVPEVYSGFLDSVKYAKRIIWWLSVDFYEQSTPRNVARHFLEKKRLPLFLTNIVLIYGWLSNRHAMMQRFSFKKIDFKKEKDIYHYYNCEYARQKLINLGIEKKNMAYLCGPISNVHFNKKKKVHKENIIAYNPKKGLKFTEEVIKFSKAKGYNFKFEKIENMSPSEVNELLAKAKIYIDFGYFPGPERIPREAVLADCIVITSKIGAAGNSIDVPIPEEYKFDRSSENLNSIVKILADCLEDYSSLYYVFEDYRIKVKEQLTLFNIETKKIAELSLESRAYGK
jgi:hypothetical protein